MTVIVYHTDSMEVVRDVRSIDERSYQPLTLVTWNEGEVELSDDVVKLEVIP